MWTICVRACVCACTYMCVIVCVLVCMCVCVRARVSAHLCRMCCIDKINRIPGTGSRYTVVNKWTVGITLAATVISYWYRNEIKGEIAHEAAGAAIDPL